MSAPIHQDASANYMKETPVKEPSWLESLLGGVSNALGHVMIRKDIAPLVQARVLPAGNGAVRGPKEPAENIF